MSQQQQVVNVAEGVELNTSLGFIANAVTINNLTQSWAYEKQSQTFIPPYQYGVVIPIPGTDTGDIQWRTPTSLPVGPVGTGTLSATYTSDSLAPSNGVSVFTQQTQVVLDNGFTGIATKQYTLPAGCQALLIGLLGGGPCAISVFGSTSLFLYASLTLGGGGGSGGPNPAAIIPVSTLLDSKVSVVCGTAGQSIGVIALFTSEPEPFPAVQNVNLTLLGGSSLLAPVAQLYLPVLQRPTFNVVAPGNTAYAANTGQTLIAAPGVGFSIVLRRIYISPTSINAALSIILVGTVSGGGTLGAMSIPLPAAAEPQLTPPPIDYGDFLVGDNNAVIITATTAIHLDITAMYSVVTTANWPTG